MKRLILKRQWQSVEHNACLRACKYSHVRLTADVIANLSHKLRLSFRLRVTFIRTIWSSFDPTSHCNHLQIETTKGFYVGHLWRFRSIGQHDTCISSSHVNFLNNTFELFLLFWIAVVMPLLPSETDVEILCLAELLTTNIFLNWIIIE